MKVSFPDMEGWSGEAEDLHSADKEENCPTLKQQKQGEEVHLVKVELILKNIGGLGGRGILL